ncbi:MAG: efflux RND transporter periplasmic adaptor subunit [Salinivirgaceae bacterium]|nr:efflux RND transporter periplasmic adaptor subunit [Salinivirgaceae bacterium]
MKLFNLLLVIVVCVCAYSCSNEASADHSSKLNGKVSPPIVDTLTVELADFRKEILSTGKLRAAEKAEVRFRASGQIADIKVKTGDKVTKGQLLAVLNDEEIQLKLRKYQINLNRAVVEFKDILIGQGYNPEDTSAVPANFLTIAKTKSGYSDALVAYDELQYAFRATKLYAPFEGVISDLSIKKWEHISSGEIFCTLINNEKFHVCFSLLESEIQDAEIRKIIIVSPLAGGEFIGVIDQINPSVDENGLVTVWGLIDNKAKTLLDGMNVRVNMITQISNQIVIPKTAVLQRQNRQVVFTLKNDSIAIWNYIKTIHENSSCYAISEGLVLTDVVIVEGNLNLAHESVVTIKEEK